MDYLAKTQFFLMLVFLFWIVKKNNHFIETISPNKMMPISA